jgi:hypothetical protein
MAMYLIENGVNEQTANRIQTLLDKDGPFDEIIAHLKGFTRATTEVRSPLPGQSRTALLFLGIEIAKEYHRRVGNDR